MFFFKHAQTTSDFYLCVSDSIQIVTKKSQCRLLERWGKMGNLWERSPPARFPSLEKHLMHRWDVGDMSQVRVGAVCCLHCGYNWSVTCVCCCCGRNLRTRLCWRKDVQLKRQRGKGRWGWLQLWQRLTGKTQVLLEFMEVSWDENERLQCWGDGGLQGNCELVGGGLLL